MILEKGRFRLTFNRHANGEGAFMLDIDGSGGITMFLNKAEMMKLSRALWYAVVKDETS